MLAGDVDLYRAPLPSFLLAVETKNQPVVGAGFATGSPQDGARAGVAATNSHPADQSLPEKIWLLESAPADGNGENEPLGANIVLNKENVKMAVLLQNMQICNLFHKADEIYQFLCAGSWLVAQTCRVSFDGGVWLTQAMVDVGDAPEVAQNPTGLLPR